MHEFFSRREGSGPLSPVTCHHHCGLTARLNQEARGNHLGPFTDDEIASEKPRRGRQREHTLPCASSEPFPRQPSEPRGSSRWRVPTSRGLGVRETCWKRACCRLGAGRADPRRRRPVVTAWGALQLPAGWEASAATAAGLRARRRHPEGPFSYTVPRSPSPPSGESPNGYEVTDEVLGANRSPSRTLTEEGNYLGLRASYPPRRLSQHASAASRSHLIGSDWVTCPVLSQPLASRAIGSAYQSLPPSHMAEPGPPPQHAQEQARAPCGFRTPEAALGVLTAALPRPLHPGQGTRKTGPCGTSPKGPQPVGGGAGI
ncbi:uncharacterized protein LOC119872956 [Canis lupus familiaris]|uniref:uncharacterized protein LOC119872956 n=1 Tax=Canis lupus familiaris TaxID=9615 RepID=UPI0003ADC10F|nr:uncharacterized protein LOC119872956 [Canis lupus familiaris]XP_038528938.1 uncharacterized protein LOC119872956 [Canis lupus familiaris]